MEANHVCPSASRDGMLPCNARYAIDCLEWFARWAQARYLEARGSWAKQQGVDLNDPKWVYLFLPADRDKMLSESGIQDVFAAFLRFRLTSKQLYDYAMNHLDHSSTTQGILRLYYSDVIWAQLPMRGCKGAHSRNPETRGCNSLPVFDHPHCQSCVNFAQTCVRSTKMLGRHVKIKEIDTRIHTCQFCLPVQTPLIVVPAAPGEQLEETSAGPVQEVATFGTLSSLRNHHSLCLHAFFMDVVGYLEALRSGKNYDVSTRVKAVQLVIRFVHDKMVVPHSPEIPDRFQLLRDNFWDTDEEKFKLCEWLRLFLLAVLTEHTDIENAERATLAYCASECKYYACPHCHWHRTPSAAQKHTDVKRHHAKHMQTHELITCPCCNQKVSAADVQEHLSSHDLFVGEVKCGPRDTIDSVISSAVEKQAGGEAFVWDPCVHKFEDIRWSCGDFTDQNRCRAEGIVDLLTRVTTDVLGNNPLALDVFMCVSLSMYWRRPGVVQQNGRRVVSISHVVGIIHMLHYTHAPHAENGAIKLIDYAIDLASRLQPEQPEAPPIDIDYTDSGQTRSSMQLFNRLCEAARPDDLRRRMPLLVHALDGLQSVLVSQIQATSGPSDGPVGVPGGVPGLNTVCVAHQILETKIKAPILSHTFKHLPLTLNELLAARIAKLHSGIVNQQNPKLTKAKTVPEQRSLLNLINRIRPGFPTSVSSLRDIFTHLAKHSRKYCAPQTCQELVLQNTSADAPFPFHVGLNRTSGSQPNNTDVYDARLSTRRLQQLYIRLVNDACVYPMYCCGVDKVASSIGIHRIFRYMPKSRTVAQELHLTDSTSGTLDPHRRPSKKRRTAREAIVIV